MIPPITADQFILLISGVRIGERNIRLIPGWLKKNSRNDGPGSSAGGATAVVGVVGLIPGESVATPSIAGVGVTGTGRTRGAGVVTLSGAWIACNIRQYRYCVS